MLDNVLEIAGTENSVIMTQHGSSAVSHAVTRGARPIVDESLDFSRSGDHARVALANDWL
jgi:hypothetical protein